MMLQGTAKLGVRRRGLLRRAGSSLLAIVVGLAAGALVGLGIVTSESAPHAVSRAVLDDSHASLVSPAAVPAPATAPAGAEPSPASPVALVRSRRAARPGVTAGDIPAAAWEAYLRATAVLAKAAPRCGLDWPVLAAIGLVESDHGRDLPEGGRSAPGLAAPDTDGGRLDGDPRRDHPIGPMRLLPSTWLVIGVDGDGDGVRSPTDLDDAALAVGVALCAGDSDLGSPAGLRRALLRYAPSPAYVHLVIGLARSYAQENLDLPDAAFTVTTVAHPVVEGTRTALAHRGLARRVKAAQAAAAASVGVGTSPAAQLLAAAQASGGPSPSSASASAPSPSATGSSATGSPLAPAATTTSSGSPTTESGGTTSAAPGGTPSDGTTGPPPGDQSPAASPSGDQPGSGPTASGEPSSGSSGPDPQDSPSATPDPQESTSPSPDASADPTPDAPADACPSAEPGATTDPATDPTADPTPCPDAPSPTPAPGSTTAPAAADAPTAGEPSATHPAG